MIRIAHLSDIHFGDPFDVATWDAVTAEVIDFEPDVIVVSGDLVHHPSPGHLLAAKCALRSLSVVARQESAKRSGDRARAAQLVIVPGNHDVFESGIGVRQSRLNWFERIFDHENTDQAEQYFERETGCTVGFNEGCRVRPALRPTVAARARAAFGFSPKADFTQYLQVPSASKPSVLRPAGSPILFALLDSNSGGGVIELATGLVGDDQLITLKRHLDNEPASYLVRIAVVHHHVLPVAFAEGRLARREPAMVLRNAGTVLRILADYRFDLVLHGHWHKPQVARLDLGTEDGEEYPITVVSAGSAAYLTDDPSGNSFNLITIEDNGRILVRTVFYGAGQSPNLRGERGRQTRDFPEPIAAAKRRAFVRAQQRHRIGCDLRVQACRISETGDLQVQHGVEGLRLRSGPEPYTKRPFSVLFPSHGRFVDRTLRLDKASRRAGARIVRASASSTASHMQDYWIQLPGKGLDRDGVPAAYEIEHACANCIAMTRWEALERANAQTKAGDDLPDEWDEEWVGVRVVYPARRMVLSATFPESLDGVEPYVRCSRHPNYPAYPIDALGDADLPSTPQLIIDPPLQEEEQTRLSYDAPHRTWHLRVDRPMVGYHYQLRWRVPGADTDPQVEAYTQWWQRLLLDLGERVAAGRQTPADRAAVEAFRILRDTMVRLLSPGGEDRCVVALFVYDPGTTFLRPALSHRSWSTEFLPSDFKIPLGGGVTGASFQQRRIVPWGRTWARTSLIEPIPHPPAAGEEPVAIRNVLALPIYHPQLQDMPRPPPWATIGVVSFGSSSIASPVTVLGTKTPLAEQGRRQMRALAQTHVIGILSALRGDQGQGKVPSPPSPDASGGLAAPPTAS